MRTSITFCIALIMGLSALAQTPSLKGGFNWKNQISYQYSRGGLDELTQHRPDCFEYQAVYKYDTLTCIFFANSGLTLRFTKDNGFTLCGMEYGTASYYQQTMVKLTEKANTAKEYPGSIPFNFSLNSSVEEVERMIGEIQLRKDPEFDTISYFEASDIPGFDDFILKLSFMDEKLVAVEVRTQDVARWYRNKETYRTDFGFLQENLMTLYFINKRIATTTLHSFVKNTLDKCISGMPIVNTSQTTEELKALLNANEVFYNKSISGNVLTVIWCVDQLVDKPTFYDRLAHNFYLYLDSTYDRVGAKELALVAYLNHIEVPGKELYYYSVEDAKNYKSNNVQPVVHLYYRPIYNEIVMQVAEVGSDATAQNPKRFEKIYHAVCTPADSAYTVSNEDFVARFHVPVSPTLEKWYKQMPGDALLLGLMEDPKSDFFVSNFASKNLAETEGNQPATFFATEGVDENMYVTRLRIYLPDYKGLAPFGLKKGMSGKDMQKIFPDFIYDGGKYTGSSPEYKFVVKISEQVSIKVHLNFKDYKLEEVLFFPVVDHGPRTYNLQKFKLFPAVSPSIY